MFLRILPFLAFGMMACLPPAMASESAHAATPPLLQPKDRILFEGDSLTDGLKNNYGRQMGWDKTWAHRVDEWLFTHRPALQLECKNLAVGGSSTRSLLARAEAAAAYKPTVVLFTIGTNDAIMRIPLDEFRKNLVAWCDRLRAAGCRDFVLVGGFVACPNADTETREILSRCLPYWEAACEVLETRGGRAIDVGPYLQSRADALDKRWPHHTVYSNGVHYNALGNELIAGAVLASLGFWKPD